MVEAILAGMYPPILPDPSSWPANYAVGDELEWASGGEYTWYEDVLDWPASYHDPVGVVLHHTASYPTDCIVNMGDIANLHTYGDGYGYGDVGYHIIVCQDDTGIYIYENRFSGDVSSDRDPWGNLYVVGAHSYPNTGYVGVALLGEFSDEAPTDQEMDSGIRYINGDLKIEF